MPIRILQGDCRALLPTLPAESVQCCVTSPPYFGLRDYGTAEWSGGDPGCDHSARRRDPRAERPRHGLTGGTETVEVATLYRDRCLRCGAVRIDGQIGAEPNPDTYVAALVDVFRAVRRVLRPDGTVWLNLGDSYARDNRVRWDNTMHREAGWKSGQATRDAPADTGAKPKDLLGIPWRVAFALQADGWWLRSAIVWHKPNPMPESVRDRPTSAYEMVFLLTAAERYLYDADAIAENGASPREFRNGTRGDGTNSMLSGRASRQADGPTGFGTTGTRNARNVWTIATAPSSIGHFALMPPALAERCIRAGTSERGCCPACGAAWDRIAETSTETHRYSYALRTGRINGDSVEVKGRAGDVTKRTIGWRQTCSCLPADPIPCTILDPFAGAGTTGLVADRLGRDAVLIDLSAIYTEAGHARIAGDCPLFAEVSTAPA
jgi:DNA modification methylase